MEEDDVSSDARAHYIQRSEPMPWGTLRLKDYGERFNEAVTAVMPYIGLVFVDGMERRGSERARQSVVWGRDKAYREGELGRSSAAPTPALCYQPPLRF
jgi:hypothetical protein